LDVQGLCYGPDIEKIKFMCENLRAVCSSDVGGKQFYEEIHDCKMLASSRAT